MPFKYPSLRTTLPIAGYHARLDAGAAATDQFTADGSQDGTLTNGATRAGSPLAYSLDGTDDFINLGDTTALGFVGTGKKFTVSAWVNFDVLPVSFCIASKARNATFNSGWLFDVSSSAGVYRLRAATADGFFGNRLISRATITIATGVFYHVAVTFDGALTPANAFKFYLNGVLLTTINDESDTTQIASNALTAKIGAIDLTANPGTPAGLFDGFIDDCVIYDITVSAANIGHLASQRGAIYAVTSAGRLINGTSLVRPAGTADHSPLIIGAT